MPRILHSILARHPWAGALVAAMILAGCNAGEPPPSLPDPIRAGFSEEPPYAFLDSDGRVMGEAPETLRRAAEALGLAEPEWIRMPFDEILPALRAGRIDVAASGHLTTAARAEEVRFTHPSVCPLPALLVTPAAAARVESLADLVTSDDLVLTVLGGSTEETASLRLGIPPARILTVYDVRSAAVALGTGQGQALAITLPTARWLAASELGDGLVVVGPYAPPLEVADLFNECSALAVRPGDDALLQALDGVLPAVMADAGHLRRLQALGFERFAVPEGVGSGS
jgi:polar amino acid transport system substrate-binding protein